MWMRRCRRVSRWSWRGGQGIGDFGDVRQELITARDGVEEADLEAELSRSGLEAAKEWLHPRLNLFKARVLGAMGQSVYARVLPPVPGIGARQEVFSKPMPRAKKLWGKINVAPPVGFTAPLLLADNTTLAAFAAKEGELAGLYGAVTGTEQDFALALADRDAVQERLYEMNEALPGGGGGALSAGDATAGVDAGVDGG